MKKALILTVLGIAAGVAPSFGQGYIRMSNYDLVGGTTPVYSGVSYGPGIAGHPAGSYIGSSGQADLLVSLDGGVTFNLVPGSTTSFWSTGVDGGDPTVDGAGTFVGGTMTINGYTSGPVQFQVRAWTGGSSYANAAGSRSTSAPFTIASLQTNPLLTAADLINDGAGGGLQPFSTLPIPEPSTFALAGLGAASMLIFRRRNA